VMLYDLPRRFGKTLKLKFFQHDVHWVQGPVFYAARTKALLVPFVTFENANGESCCDLQPLVSFAGNENTLPQVAQSLVDIAQRYIREYPAQWLQWPSIPAMLNAGDE
ncbi:MAG: hypothetical protein GXP16_11990, partial [Gammaproteobacteria bacterium]|nr:hypothetical protein [Gammaproteobacteria bacterium]